MPGFDGRGPRGYGPGRGLGPCRSNNIRFDSQNGSDQILKEIENLKNEIINLKEQINILKDK